MKLINYCLYIALMECFFFIFNFKKPYLSLSIIFPAFVLLLFSLLALNSINLRFDLKLNFKSPFKFTLPFMTQNLNKFGMDNLIYNFKGNFHSDLHFPNQRVEVSFSLKVSNLTIFFSSAPDFASTFNSSHHS